MLQQCCTTACDQASTDLTWIGDSNRIRGSPYTSEIVQLNTDFPDTPLAPPVHLLTQRDALDITVQKLAEQNHTPRLQGFRDGVRLPLLRRYPVPPGCSPDDSEDFRRSELLRVYQDFTVELYKGVHMTQLGVNQDYSNIHCQILEDLQTLKVDQGSGCIIEFPLSAVSKIYRIVKNDNRWFKAGSLTGPSPMPPLPLSNAEHIVVVEFMRRKLAFVFSDMDQAHRFLMCMELLIRRAQEVCQESGLLMPFGGRRVGKNDHAIAPMFSAYKHGPSGRQPAPPRSPPISVQGRPESSAARDDDMTSHVPSHTGFTYAPGPSPSPPVKGPEPAMDDIERGMTEDLDGVG